MNENGTRFLRQERFTFISLILNLYFSYSELRISLILLTVFLWFIATELTWYAGVCEPLGTFSAFFENRLYSSFYF